ncbi:hypothetical protein QZH41_020591 [Actinostola sp. cb2023]|nr:hypothetical protein QZH41_020591 [Actinostola sp. cb2023]
MCSHGNVSPIRSQLSSDVDKISSSTNRYYKRKAVQAVETVLDAIAPGKSAWLFQQVTQNFSRVTDTDMPENVPFSGDFISSPSFLQDVAYGTKYIKLSDGQKLEIPNVVRTVITSRLIHLYQSYCAKSGFSPLGRSTLFNILKVCAASQKKSLAGLDSTQTDGVCALGTLEETSNELSKLGNKKLTTFVFVILSITSTINCKVQGFLKKHRRTLPDV